MKSWDDARLLNSFVVYRGMDDTHTVESTIKLIETESQCLIDGMGNNRLASFKTFRRRRVLSLHCIKNKLSLSSTRALNQERWGCALIRPCIAARDWKERIHWMKVFELFVKMHVSVNSRKIKKTSIIHLDAQISFIHCVFILFCIEYLDRARQAQWSIMFRARWIYWNWRYRYD